jgi:hypothetical protein
LKLKIIDEALEKVGNSKKKNSFNDTEISFIFSNKNNDNTSQINDFLNNSNNNLNDSKYAANNYIIPVSNNSKGKIIKGKKNIYLIHIIIFNRNKQTLFNETKHFFCT